MTDASPRLDAALYLARNGARVFPLHSVREDAAGRLVCTCGNPQCEDAGKHPMAKLAPRGLLSATTHEHIVRAWFTKAPFANVGMATGKTVVLDVDPRHGGDASLAALEAEHGPLPETTRALTGGGGQHILFRAPDGIESDYARSNNEAPGTQTSFGDRMDKQGFKKKKNVPTGIGSYARGYEGVEVRPLPHREAQ